MKKRRKRLILLLAIILLLIGGGFLVVKLLPNNTQEKESQTENSPNPQAESTPTPQIEDSSTSQTQEDKVLKEKLAKLENINEKIDYFNMDYLDRYLAYLEKNPTMDKKDIVTRVNIGLDYDYYTHTKTTPYQNKIYILSNKYISMGDYVPNDLEKVSSSCSTGTRLMVKEARVAFENMCNKAKSDGYTIRAMSTYRSYEYQVGLYQRYVDQDGVEEADTYSARPGFSEHQTGLVADIDNGSTVYTQFHTTKEYQWMKDNAYKYGFIERYPKGKENITGYTYESWHYRYVGKEIATYIHEHNITFDEYYVQFIEGKK